MAAKDACAPFREALYEETGHPGIKEHLRVCADCRNLKSRLKRRDRAEARAPIPKFPERLLKRILALGSAGQERKKKKRNKN